MSFLTLQKKNAQSLRTLPNRPGVYVFRDAEKRVLYVGRATSLRARVASYFSGRDSRGERIFQMVDRARYLETTETETVLESVILEANLIKKYRPKYNVDLKDDKSFSYFAVTKEKFPRVVIVRETEVFFPPLQRGGGESASRRVKGETSLFPPLQRGGGESANRRAKGETSFFPPLQRGGGESASRRGSGLGLKIKNEELRRKEGDSFVQPLLSEDGHLPLCRGRKTSASLPTSPPLPPLRLADSTLPLGQGKVMEKYRKVYGPYPSKRHMETVLKILRRIFPFHSAKAQSEKGCLYRQIGLCPGPYDGGIDKDAYRKNIRSIEYVLRGQKKRLLATLEKEMAQEAKRENFERAQVLRDQVFALRHIRDIALLTRNTEYYAEHGTRNTERRKGIEDGMQNTKDGTLYGTRNAGLDFLGVPRSAIQIPCVLSDDPRSVIRVPRIEAYDISNISGQHAVASMVVFENGEPKKSEYRKFKIQSVEGSNDVAMMREVLARRVRHAEWKIPHLIILDGGQGHLNMAVSLWKALNVHIPLVAIAKGPTRKKVELHVDPQFAPDPKLLEDVRVLEHLREEAHRFAITYHRKVRGESFLGQEGG